jgi:hypothetical protein
MDYRKEMHKFKVLGDELFIINVHEIILLPLLCRRDIISLNTESIT